jgi:hypothetical protein
MSMRALRQLTEFADHTHNEAMATLREELGEAHLSEADPTQVATRRNFVRNLGLGGAAIAFGTMLVPVAGLLDQAAAQIPAPTDAGADVSAADTNLLVFAQGLELTAQAVYASITATGKLQGQQLQSARTFALHHRQHASLLASLTPKAKVPTQPNSKILALFSGQIDSAPDANALLQIAFNVESGAASTYQLAMGALQNWQGAAAVATIEPIEAQHATVWGQTLNLPTEQWLPAFQTTAASLNPTTYAAS